MSTRPTATAARRQGAPKHGWGWGRWFWRTLTSMRTAVILLVLLAVAAIPGSIFPQRNVASNPLSVLRFARDYPTLYPWLDKLGMFEVYASPWFAAIYILLLVSMTGCVLPRCVRLWQAARSAPIAAPRNLTRMEHHHSWIAPAPSSTFAYREEILARTATILRRRRFRVVVTDHEVRAERGYLREVGNLLFHLSLLILLFGMAAGKLFGFEGRVALAEGDTFTNVAANYDEFNPSVWTDVDSLEPFSFTLDEFDVEYAPDGPKRGEPRAFAATLTYKLFKNDLSESSRVEVSPNHPLNINETKAFLTGHGYAPVVTVRDGRDEVVFSGSVIFLPIDSSFVSDGVIKAPDANPEQLGFEGIFFPTVANGPNGLYSAFPEALAPLLILNPFVGDLGLNDGLPQSVYELDTSRMEPVRDDKGKPVEQPLAIGETLDLPDGQGSITFDGFSRFANFQIAHDPGKELSLLAAVMLLVGLTASLSIKRRRIWLRAEPDPSSGSVAISVAGQSLTRWPMPHRDIDRVLTAFEHRSETKRSSENQ